MKAMLPALFLVLTSVSLILFWELSPPEEGVVLVVFAPGSSVNDLGAKLRRADAALVGTSTLPNGFLVSSKMGGLPARLKREGAMLVLNANPSLGCTLSRSETS